MITYHGVYFVSFEVPYRKFALLVESSQQGINDVINTIGLNQC